MLKKIISVIVILTKLFDIRGAAEEYDYGVSELYDNVPDEARKFITDNSISPDGSGISELDISTVLDSVISEISTAVSAPITMFAAILAVIILISVLKNMVSSESSSTEAVFSVVTALTSTVIISGYLTDVLNNINSAIGAVSDFSLTYIPVIAGVIAVGGHTSTAAIYTSVMIIGIQILTQITVNFLFPLTGSLIGISAAAGINRDLKIEKVGDGLKRAIVWLLGLLMTFFIGFLTLQTNISASADTIALRVTRFAVSSSVPFVGGAVSDALSTVKTSVELLKSGIGSFGIITGCCVLFPVLIEALCFKFFLFLSGVISDVLDTEDVGRMIKCGENVISIVISMIICFFLFLTISTTLMVLLCRQ